MDRLERELAELLKAPTDKPARSVDATALVTRRRNVGIALAAAAVVAIAVSVALIVTRHSSQSPQATGRVPRTAQSTGTTSPGNPKAVAFRTVDTTLSNAPLPPGALHVGRSIAGLTSACGTPVSPNLIDRAQWWTAPGTVDAALAYVTAHRPSGMSDGGSGSSSGGGQPTIDCVEFDGPARLSLQYSVMPFAGGIAIRVDAMTIWVADRPGWSYIPSPVTSVDVTVVRQNPQLHQGAPTVRRTLTGASAQSLADRVNRYGLLPTYGAHSCPADLGGEQRSDTLVFHTARGAFRVLESMTGCSFLSITDGRHKQVALDGNLDPAVLRALGLPANYGSS